MPTSVGVLTKCAIKANSAWGADFSAPSQDLIPILSESIIAEYLRMQNDALLGTAGRRQSDRGALTVRGSLELEMDFYNFSFLLECALGGVDNSIHYITDRLSDYLQLEFDKQVSRWRVNTAMVNAVEISGKVNESFKMTLELICHKVERSATAFPNLTLANYKRMMFNEIVSQSLGFGFMVGDLADSLSSSDARPVEEFKLRLERNLTEPEWDTNSHIYTLEPIPNNFRKATLELGLSRYEFDTFPAWQDADTALQATWLLTYDTRVIAFYVPQMKISSIEYPIAGPGIVKPKVKLDCFMNTDNSYQTCTNEFEIHY